MHHHRCVLVHSTKDIEQRISVGIKIRSNDSTYTHNLSFSVAIKMYGYAATLKRLSAFALAVAIKAWIFCNAVAWNA